MPLGKDERETIIRRTEVELHRFSAKFVLDGGCWRWTGAKGHVGYGRFSLRRRIVDAHRASWIIFHDVIPKNMQVCHSCDNKLCVNPAHLWLGTQSDNLKDAAKKGRLWFQKDPARIPRGEQSYSHRHPELMRGERNGRATITNNEAAEIKKLRGLGMKPLAIHKLTGVRRTVIEGICWGRAWQYA